jgi:hypothetical protein
VVSVYHGGALITDNFSTVVAKTIKGSTLVVLFGAGFGAIVFGLNMQRC